MKHYIRFGHHKSLTKFFNQVFPNNIHFRGNRERFLAYVKSPGSAETSRFLSLNNSVVNIKNPFLDKSKFFHIIRAPQRSHCFRLLLSQEKVTEDWTNWGIRFQHYHIYRLELVRVFSDSDMALLDSRLSMRELLETLSFEKGMMLGKWCGENIFAR